MIAEMEMSREKRRGNVDAADIDGVMPFLSDFIRQSSEAPKDGAPRVRECMYWLRDRLVDWGWGPYLDLWDGSPDEPNIAVRLPGRSGRSALMFNGHADVVPVPAEEVSSWKYPPYGGRIAEGRIWGRGASDMKGGVAAFLWAAKLVFESEEGLANDLILTINVGEESARPRVGIESVLKRGYHAPLVINAEPSGLRLCIGACGWFFFTVEVKGKATHPANRHLYLDDRIPIEQKPGIDAIEKLVKIMNGLKTLESSWQSAHSPLFPPKSTNMTCVHIEGGDRSAAMASDCRATYAVIYDTRYKGKEIIDQIQGVLNHAAEEDEWLRGNPPLLRVPDVDEVIYEVFGMNPDDEVVHELSSAFRRATGADAEVGIFPCPSDANIASAMGCRTVVIGPGDLSFGCHGIDEYMPVDDMRRAVKIYSEMIKARCCGVA
jgi:acetylornithine deacetylase/succinyl-diaminopimelate desuccinylase-like protein